MSPSADDHKGPRRRALLAARRVRTDDDRRSDAEALVAGLDAVLDGVGDLVCLYVPVGTEPGAGTLLPDAALARGHHVLLPVTVADAPLDWAPYTGPSSLGPGPHGLLEPTAARLGAGAITESGLVLVPALAVDRRGVRLGRGGGHYDRSLALLGPATTRRVALVGDDELVDDPLPAEPHDVRVHAVWRPRHGLTELWPGPSARERAGPG